MGDITNLLIQCNHNVIASQVVVIVNKQFGSQIPDLHFFIQFNVPFKIISAHMRRANQ